MLLLIVQIVFGVMIFMNKDQIKDSMTDLIHKLWNQRTDHMGFWNSVQPAVSWNFHCICIENLIVCACFSLDSCNAAV